MRYVFMLDYKMLLSYNIITLNDILDEVDFETDYYEEMKYWHGNDICYESTNVTVCHA